MQLSVSLEILEPTTLEYVMPGLVGLTSLGAYPFLSECVWRLTAVVLKGKRALLHHSRNFLSDCGELMVISCIVKCANLEVVNCSYCKTMFGNLRCHVRL